MQQLVSDAATPLPQRYFELMEAGALQVEVRQKTEPNATLEFLENTPKWKHFGYSILAPAVLYSKADPANRHYHDPAMRALAVGIGDLLASENEKVTMASMIKSTGETPLPIVVG